MSPRITELARRTTQESVPATVVRLERHGGEAVHVLVLGGRERHHVIGLGQEQAVLDSEPHSRAAPLARLAGVGVVQEVDAAAPPP